MKTSESKSLCIRNGALLDSHGVLALALRETVYKSRLSFANIGIRVIGPALAPRLMLAAINLSLVGISKFKKNQSDTQRCATICIPSYVVRMLKYPQEDRFSNEVLVGEKEMCEPVKFELNCLGCSSELQPCVGVGIISSVNLLEQSLDVIISNHTNLEDKATSYPESILEDSDLQIIPKQNEETAINFVKGNIQIPTALLYCVSDVVSTPYMSGGEIYGEGSGIMIGARTNLKRRGHQLK